MLWLSPKDHTCACSVVNGALNLYCRTRYSEAIECDAMVNFCPNCGAKLSSSDVKFCSECGAKIALEPLKLEESREVNCSSCGAIIDPNSPYCPKCNRLVNPSLLETKPIESTTKSKTFGEVIIGIIIIAALYLFPYATLNNRNLSIADLNSLCDSGIGQFAQLLVQTNCSTYNAIFIIGWIVGIVFILIGIFRK